MESHIMKYLSEITDTTRNHYYNQECTSSVHVVHWIYVDEINVKMMVMSICWY
jgi:hypothetical protein